MDYLTFGNEKYEAIVFLHGWGGGFSSFAGLAKSLAKKYFVVLIDYSSFINQQKEICVKDYADALYTILDKTNKKQFSFVAHSFGGRVLAKLYRDHPEIFKKIVLFNTAGLPRRFNLWYYLKVKRRNFVKKLVFLNILPKSKLEQFASADYKKLNSIERKSFSNIVSEDLTNCYKNIKVPTLIYWGKKDKETPLYMAKRLKKIIKNSGLYVDKNAGHFSYLDNPQSAQNAIEYFLEK